MITLCKWIFRVAFLLLLVASAGLYVILSGLDFNELKPEIARRVKAITGRELTINGDIGLKIDLSPALIMDQVTIRNVRWGSRQEMVRIKRFEMHAALLPLLSGKIEMDRYVLVEPAILIETDQAGRLNLNFDDSGEVSSFQRGSESPIQWVTPPTHAAGEVEIRQGILRYQDGPSGKAYAVAVEHLTAASSGPEGVIALRGSGAAHGIAFECSGSVGPLSAVANPDGTWPVKLTALAAGITVNVEGALHDALHAGDYSFDLEVHGPSAADLIRLVKGGTGPELGPFKALMKLVGRKKSLAVESLDIEVGLEELVAWKFSGRFRDPLAWRGAEIAFRVFGKDLALVGGLARRPIPIGGPFEVSGQVSDTTEKVYQLTQLKVAVGENDVAGALQLDFRAGRPSITGTVVADKLDLRPFLSREGNEESAAGISTRTARSGRVFPADPLSLEGLKKVDAKLQIGAQQVFIPRLVIDNLAARVVLEEGDLTLTSLKAAVGGGTLDGRIALQPKGKAVGVEAAVEVSGVDVDVVAGELQLAEQAGGKVDFDFNIKGEGGSVAEIMAGLNGRSLLAMSKGRIDNRYLDLLGADVGNCLLRVLNPVSPETSPVEINRFISGFEICEGIARSTALEMETSHTMVVGEGTINLKTEELDFSFRPSLKEGAVESAAGELTRPFKLGGSLARPAVGD